MSTRPLNDKRNTRIIGLIRAGDLTYQEIADALKRDYPGLTRNAVSGIANTARKRKLLPPATPAQVVERLRLAGRKVVGQRAPLPPVPAHLGGIANPVAFIVALYRLRTMTGGQVSAHAIDRFPQVTDGQVRGILVRLRKGLDPAPRGRLDAKPTPAPKVQRVRAPEKAAAPVVALKAVRISVSDDANGYDLRRAAFARMTASGGCKFPIGDPRAADFHYCCAARRRGAVYCDDHAAVAYAQPGRRDEPFAEVAA